MTKEKIYNTTTWIIIATLVLGFIAGFVVARFKYRTQIGLISTMVMDKASEINTLTAENNRYFMVSGGMMEERNGIVSRMIEDTTLSDGTIITMGGKAVKTDGSIIILKNGESVLMNGMMNRAMDTTQ
jgi:hypothetical protein